MDYRIVRASGEVRWIEARGIVSYDSNLQPQRVIRINIDVTDRKRSEARLVERNAQFDLAHKAAGVGCYTYDIAARTMQVSLATIATYGLSEGNSHLVFEWQEIAGPLSRYPANPAMGPAPFVT